MIVYGKQVINYLLERHPALIKRVMLAKEIEKKQFSSITKRGIRVERLDEKKAQALSRGNNHQGILAELEEFAPTPVENLKRYNRLIILCGITAISHIGDSAQNN